MKIFILLMLFMLSACNKGAKHFAAPVEGDVTEIILVSESFGKVVPGIGVVAPMIVVPRSSYGSILNQLNGATRDDSPMKWVALAHLRITTKTRTLEIGLFRTGEGFGAFKVDQVYYRTSDEAAMIRGIQSVIQQQEGEQAVTPNGP